MRVATVAVTQRELGWRADSPRPRKREAENAAAEGATKFVFHVARDGLFSEAPLAKQRLKVPSDDLVEGRPLRAAAGVLLRLAPACSGCRCGVAGRAAQEELAGWWQIATTDASRAALGGRTGAPLRTNERGGLDQLNTQKSSRHRRGPAHAFRSGRNEDAGFRPACRRVSANRASEGAMPSDCFAWSVSARH